MKFIMPLRAFLLFKVHPPALPQEVHKEEVGEAGEVPEDPHNCP
jgi:hypothetical protein